MKKPKKNKKSMEEIKEKTQTKFCSKCGEEKPLSAFNKKSSNDDGLQDWCRECQKAHYRETYAEIKVQRYNHKKELKEKKAAMDSVFENSSSLLPKTLSIPTRKPVEPAKDATKNTSEVLAKISTTELMKVVKSRKDFSIKDAFTPRELMKALYDFGYRGSLDITVKQTVTLSAQD